MIELEKIVTRLQANKLVADGGAATRPISCSSSPVPVTANGTQTSCLTSREVLTCTLDRVTGRNTCQDILRLHPSLEMQTLRRARRTTLDAEGAGNFAPAYIRKF